MAEHILSRSLKELVDSEKIVPGFSVPHITEGTTSAISRELHLGVPLSVTHEEAHTAKQPYYHPYSLSLKMTEEEFSELFNRDQTKVFANTLEGFLDQFNDDSDLANSAAIGAAITLRAIRTEMGQDFYQKISEYTYSDYAQARGKGILAIRDRGLVIKRAKSILRLPEYQFHLRRLITDLSLMAPDEFGVEDGANLLHFVLSNTWDRKK